MSLIRSNFQAQPEDNIFMKYWRVQAEELALGRAISYRLRHHLDPYTNE